MLKRILFTFSILCTSGMAYSQAGAVQLRSDGVSATRNTFFSEIRKKKGVESNNGLIETVGTPYIAREFKPCEIYYEDELVGKFFYRHNALNDEIEIKDTQIAGEEVSSLATMRQLRIVDLKTQQELTLMTYENKDDQMRNGYLYRLQEGDKYKLMFKKNVKFTPGAVPVNPLVRPTPNKFSQFIEYYYYKSDGKVAQYIPTRKNPFLRSFDEPVRDKLKDFIKEEDINIKREEDLIRVFEFLNQQA